MEIHLTATEHNWRLFMTRKGDPAFQSVAQRIFKRDFFTCRFCGFQAERFQDIINLDSNYRNNRAENMATACCFCTQCFFLEAVGKSDFGGGHLIYLPEITQVELNALCHVLFTALATGNTVDDMNAKNTYRSLRLRSQVVERELGEGFSNPALYGQLLIDAQIDPAHKKAVGRALSSKLRLLPDMARFTIQLETWLLDALKTCGYSA